jgi:Predicted Zn-dependent proteases and their inactivated homologs
VLNQNLIKNKNMMKTIRYFLVLIISVLIYRPVSIAQTSEDDIIFKAMNDELKRNMSQLTLDKRKPPFFISYQLNDVQILSMSASLGSIIYASDRPGRSEDVRLMIGDYSLNDENFVLNNSDYSTGGNYLQLPLNNDYDAIRRTFWILSDRLYKSAIESYEQKLSALKQQNKDDEEKLDDFSKITPATFIVKGNPEKYDKTKWEYIAKDISATFKAYGQINASSVNVVLGNASVYVTTSEGTMLKFLPGISCLLINANTQAEDGEQLNDHLLYYALTPDKLPAIDKVKEDVKQMADHLVALRKAPVMKDSYSGPVIFEGEAVAELCAAELFRNNKLLASRETVHSVGTPNYGAVNKLDDKINQKICSENITIKATPKIKSFNETSLIGTFEIDGEGVVPNDELVLVDKGILKTLLNDRVPTAKVKQSNGYCRFGLRNSTVTLQKAPGVINISYNNSETQESLRKNVLHEAEKNGLEYIYVVRKFNVSNIGQSRIFFHKVGRNIPASKPIKIYKVSVKTGEEQLVRSAVISDFQLAAFKQITHGTKEQIVYNTLLNSSIPASFIVPQALVFDDINIEKNKNVKEKLPVVSNPLLLKK